MCVYICVCVYVYARGRWSACVGFERNRYRPAECLGEDWTRGNGDSLWQDPRGTGVRGCVSIGLAPAQVFPPRIHLSSSRSRSRSRPRSELTALGLRERTNGCRSTGALPLPSLSLSPSIFLYFSLPPNRPRINTPAGPYFRPRNLNFCPRRRFRVVLFLASVILQ